MTRGELINARARAGSESVTLSAQYDREADVAKKTELKAKRDEAQRVFMALIAAERDYERSVAFEKWHASLTREQIACSPHDWGMGGRLSVCIGCLAPNFEKEWRR